MLTISNFKFKSRLFIGTGKFSSINLMMETIIASGSELVTLSIRRLNLNKKNKFNEYDNFILFLLKNNIKLLPNTSGARTAEEAVFAAKIAREALNTNWIKLEIHPDTQYLLPDPIETLKAANQLVKEGFVVLPYCNADPVLCRKLTEVGCAAVMPIGSPIGSNQGIKTIDFLRIIVEQKQVPVIVDAGIGSPSQALKALEIGVDAVLVNTSIAISNNPILVAKAFKLALESGEIIQESGGLASATKFSNATSSLTNFLKNKT